MEIEANLEWKEALRGLDEKYRLIVVLFYAEGLRTAEIGKLLQLPDSTVRTRLRQRTEQLAKYYAETEEGGGRKMRPMNEIEIELPQIVLERADAAYAQIRQQASQEKQLTGKRFPGQQASC